MRLLDTTGGGLSVGRNESVAVHNSEDDDEPAVKGKTYSSSLTGGLGCELLTRSLS